MMTKGIMRLGKHTMQSSLNRSMSNGPGALNSCLPRDWSWLLPPWQPSRSRMELNCYIEYRTVANNGTSRSFKSYVVSHTRSYQSSQPLLNHMILVELTKCSLHSFLNQLMFTNRVCIFLLLRHVSKFGGLVKSDGRELSVV